MATVILYRADSEECHQEEGSCWAESKADAQAYLDNPGFGGNTLHAVEFTVDFDRVLDLTGAAAVKQLANVMDRDQQDLMDLGGQVWHCWENSSRIREWLANRYDWVKYTDDFPVNCTTWCKL
jgi:hypothetical protein